MRSPSSRRTKRSADTSPRDEAAQLEFQRNNPHLFTTLTQMVGPYGELVTFDSVTKNLQETLKRLQVAHIKIFKGEHPVYCLRPVIGSPEATVCQAIELTESDLTKVRLSFLDNYKHQAEWVRRMKESRANTKPESELAL